MKAALLAGVIFVATTLSALAAPAAMLTTDQIKAIFGTGKPFTATSVSGVLVYAFTFNPDGTAVKAEKGSKDIAGKWRVSDKGYCTTWGKGSEHCYTVDKGAKGYEVRDLGGNLISTWKP